MRRLVLVWLVVLASSAAQLVRAQCEAEACLGPATSLGNLTDAQGSVLDALFSSLSGETIDLPKSLQQSLGTTPVYLGTLVGAIQDAGIAGSPSDALNADLGVSQLMTLIAGTLASQPMAQSAFNMLATQLSGVTSKISLSDILSLDDREVPLGQSQIGGLDLVQGVLTGLNAQDTSPINKVTIDGATLGIPALGVIELSTVVTEPSHFSCGKVGTEIRTAGVRIRLHAMPTTVIPLSVTGLTGLASGNIELTSLDLVLTIAPTTGKVLSIDPTNGVSVQLTPAAVELFLGSVGDAAFSDRGTPILPTSELDFATIAKLNVKLLSALEASVSIKAKGYANVAAGSTQTASAASGFPATVTVGVGSNTVTELVNSLFMNLQVQVDSFGNNPLLGVVSGALNTLTQTAVTTLKGATGTLANTVTAALNNVLGPALRPLGVAIGQTSIKVEAAPRLPIGQLCDDTKLCTSDDKCNSSGACSGLARVCADALDCTTDSCDDLLGCVFTLVGSCRINNSCVAAGTRDPSNGCRSCQPQQSTTAYTNSPLASSCDDGRYCTVGDLCDGSGHCDGLDRSCGDILTCTNDACDEDGRQCVHTLNTGCLISGLCVADGLLNVDNQCQTCDASEAENLWTALTGGNCGSPEVMLDTDGDGLSDQFECNNSIAQCPNTDGDQFPDYLDWDDDGDGLLTRFERPNKQSIDTDEDGKPNYLDANDDGDAYDTWDEDPDPNGDGDPSDARDSDADGTPDYLDPDAPTMPPQGGRGGSGAVAGRAAGGRTAPAAGGGGRGGSPANPEDPDMDGLCSENERAQGDDLDTDDDGTANRFDDDDDGDGVPSAVEGDDPNGDCDPSDARDTDGDGIPDYLDTDDDNDTIPTAREVDDAYVWGLDVDDDDRPNWLDTDSDGDGLSDEEEGPEDRDRDGVPDYLRAANGVMDASAGDASVADGGPEGGAGGGKLSGRVSGGSKCSVTPGPGRARPEAAGWALLFAIGLFTCRRARRHR